MPVVVRMARHGGKLNPFYRIVVANSRFPKEGRCIEALGTYDPTFNPPKVVVNQERLAYWKSKGAQLSNIVSDLTETMVPTPVVKKAAMTAEAKAAKKAKPATKAPAKKAAPKASATAEKTTKKAKTPAKKGGTAAH